MNNDVEFQTSTTGDHHGNFERYRSSNSDRSGIDSRPPPLFRCLGQIKMLEAIGWMLIGVVFGLLPQISIALLSVIESKMKDKNARR
jgi:hypothetical protein